MHQSKRADSRKKIRILVIEDNRVLRDGIEEMLNGESDMHVVATMGNGNTFLQKTLETKPQIILLDISLSNYRESSVVTELTEKMPEAKVVGMGLIPTQSDIVEFVQAGASGFILKNATVKEFLATIRSVAQGEKVLPPLLTGSLFTHVIEHAFKKNKANVVNAVRMTVREREIIVLIADGLGNKEIAQRLNIATHTVKSHVHNIMEKLTLHTRLQIAKYLHDENL